jgi:ARC6-like, IMS domain
MVLSKKKAKSFSQFAAQGLQASGDLTIGDITQTINHYTQKSRIEFAKRTELKEFESPNFPRVTKIDEITSQIKDQSILFLGGVHADKSDLAWYLAAHLQLLSQSSNSEKIPVYEWNKASDSKGLILAIREESEKSEKAKHPTQIFVLPDLKPKDVNFDQLQKVAKERKILIIATTDSPLKQWGLGEVQTKLWRNLDVNEHLYSPEDLAKAAVERLTQGIVLSPNIKSEVHQHVAKELYTVASVDICIQWLKANREAVSSKTVEASINSAKEDKKERLKQWFYSLEPREQLLALGITLFNGLYIDQFFAALERVVQQVWQRRDPTLQALDHCDLESLGNYFEFSEVARGDDFALRRINVKDPDEGTLLLSIAWESHRRQIITALEEIVRIVKYSAQDNLTQPSDWQIYGSPVLRERLYEGVSNPFADVGLITAEATSTVHDLLLSLASDEAFHSKNFAAKVLAHWYQRDSEKLLRTLRSFYEIAISRDVYQKDADSLSLQDCVGATVALAVSYASLNDLPNLLNSQLCVWLTTLSSSKSSLVRTYFGSHTLAYVAPRHLTQIHPILKKIAEEHVDLSSAIAQSLASAYGNNYADEVLKNLKSWLEECESKRSDKSITNVTSRERLISTTARAYGLIDCSELAGTLTPQVAFEYIARIFKGEKHPIVRSSAVEGMSDRLNKDSLIIAPMLLSIVPQFTKSDRKQLVERLTQTYLEQRARLEGGDDTCEINQRKYSVWLSTKRPLTDIEAVMLQWLGAKQNKTVQQIATQSSIAFARALDIEEDTELTRLRLEKSISLNQDGTWQVDSSRAWSDYWLAPTIAWLATVQQRVYKPSIQNILPEALEHHVAYRPGMDFVLRKWSQVSKQSLSSEGNLQLKPTSDLLRRGLWMVDNKFPLMLVSAGAAILGVWTLHTTSTSIIIALHKSMTDPVEPSPSVSVEPPRRIDGGISIDAKTGVNDVDSPNFDKGELKVSFAANATADDLLSILDQGLDSGQIGIKGNQVTYGNTLIGTFVEGDGTKPLVISLNASANPESVQVLLQNIAYKNNSTTPVLGSRTVQFELSDGSGGISKPLTRKISVMANNQDPAITTPATLSLKEGGSQKLGKVEISDPDSSQSVSVTIAAEKGSIFAKDDIAKGIKTKGITGNDGKAVELKGSLAEIKATLANLSAITYKSDEDFSGNDSITITVNDGGPTLLDKKASLIWPPSAGEPRKTSKTINVTVIPKNLPPIVTKPEIKAVDEDQPLIISGITIKEPDSKDKKQEITVTLEVAKGRIKVKPNVAQGLTEKGLSSKEAANKVVLTGSIASINRTLSDLAAIIYQGDRDYYGSDSLKIRVESDGKETEETLAITINPVNDAPEFGEFQAARLVPESPSSLSAITNLTQEGALDIIRGYFQTKREIFAPPFPHEPAARYTMGKIYEEITRPNDGKIDALKQKNQYFKFGNQQIEEVLGFEPFSDKAFISVTLREELSIYSIDGQLLTPPQNNAISYRFELRPEGSSWKIYDREKL